MENQSKLNSSKQIIAYLAERFPLCFVATGEARPLKIGIFEDLAQRLATENGVSKTRLRAALRVYTSSWRYLYGVKKGVQRVDLDGNECGELTQEHVEHARQQLDEAKARIRAQRLAQQEQRPVAKTASSSAPNSSALKTHLPAAQAKQKVMDKNTVVNVPQPHVGQSVRVKAGKSVMEATILEIAKEGIRVQLSSGLAMIVRAEHLQF